MSVQRIPGVGPTNTDIANAVAAAVPTNSSITNIVQTYATAKTMQTQTFNNSGNWTAPTGVNAVEVLVVGGGGGSGGAGNISNAARAVSAAGGGGAVIRRTVAVTPGTNYSVTVGAGGGGGTWNGNAPSTSNLNAASPGGSSSLGNLVTAEGGGGGDGRADNGTGRVASNSKNGGCGAGTGGLFVSGANFFVIGGGGGAGGYGAIGPVAAPNLMYNADAQLGPGRGNQGSSGQIGFEGGTYLSTYGPSFGIDGMGGGGGGLRMDTSGAGTPLPISHGGGLAQWGNTNNANLGKGNNAGAGGGAVGSGGTSGGAGAYARGFDGIAGLVQLTWIA